MLADVTVHAVRVKKFMPDLRILALAGIGWVVISAETQNFSL
jgi:hypothetical protein